MTTSKWKCGGARQRHASISRICVLIMFTTQQRHTCLGITDDDVFGKERVVLE